MSVAQGIYHSLPDLLRSVCQSLAARMQLRTQRFVLFYGRAVLQGVCVPHLIIPLSMDMKAAHVLAVVNGAPQKIGGRHP